MASPEDLPLSKHPYLLELQMTQFATELEDDPLTKYVVAVTRLMQLSLENLVGSYFAVDAAFAVGKSPDRAESTRLIYDEGIVFGGIAQRIGYDPNSQIPIESVFIDYSNPVVLAEEDVIDENFGEELYKSAAPVVSELRTPILAIRACAIKEIAA
jgi:hypothetical protein